MDDKSLLLAQYLFAHFKTLYQGKFTSCFADEESIHHWWNLWAKGIEDISLELVKKAAEYCVNELEWPPTIAEFRKICTQVEGIPPCPEAMDLAVKRDFKHPITRMCYLIVGDWDMTHDTTPTLKRKFTSAYCKVMGEFRKTPSWETLLAQYEPKHVKLENQNTSKTDLNAQGDAKEVDTMETHQEEKTKAPRTYKGHASMGEYLASVVKLKP